MKKFILYFILGFIFLGCSEKDEKPKNLIPEDKMMEIIYDLNILQSIRSSQYYLIESENVREEAYIYKKYNIDSLQFAESNKYYISDPVRYEQMLDKIIQRVKTERDSANAALENSNIEFKRDTLNVSSERPKIFEKLKELK